VESPLVNFRDTQVEGYDDDERETTTRPIRSEVRDTLVAWSDFDGIVYGKGAAVMKQLYYLIGHVNFSRALKEYFSRFSWSNATIDDLLEDIEPYLPASISAS
jgi:hypothetical protein